jgi:serine/threonine protein kinase
LYFNTTIFIFVSLSQKLILNPSTYNDSYFYQTQTHTYTRKKKKKPIDDDPVDALVGARICGLLLTKVLGLGTYGAVYAAEDVNAGRKKRYAVKCLFKAGLTPEHLEIQKQEISFNKKLKPHKLITNLERVIETNDYLLLVFEYCERGDLFELIRKEEAGIYDKSFACDMFLQLVDAVLYCHERGVFHRDLKPENVLLTEDWTVKLADFGLATNQVFPTDFEVGSPPYMAPEVFIHHHSYAAAPADVWSLGVIFFNMIYGQNPWAKAVSTDPHFKVFISQPQSSLNRRFAMTDELLEVFLGVFNINPLKRWTLSRLRQAVSNLNLRTMHPFANKYSSSPVVNLQAGQYMRAPRINKFPLPEAAYHDPLVAKARGNGPSSLPNVSFIRPKAACGPIVGRRASVTNANPVPPHVVTVRRSSACSASWADSDDEDMDFNSFPVLDDDVSKPVFCNSPLRSATASRHDSAYDSFSNEENNSNNDSDGDMASEEENDENGENDSQNEEYIFDIEDVKQDEGLYMASDVTKTTDISKMFAIMTTSDAPRSSKFSPISHLGSSLNGFPLTMISS